MRPRGKSSGEKHSGSALQFLRRITEEKKMSLLGDYGTKEERNTKRSRLPSDRF